MKRLLFVLRILTLTSSIDAQRKSPCPGAFEYEPPGSDPGRWYAVAHLSTDTTLHSIWLNIVLDRKADIVGNYVGDVSTKDNIDFKIENMNMKIHPGSPVHLRFFVQYKIESTPPKLREIWFNGRLLCNASNTDRVPVGMISQTTTKNIGLTSPAPHVAGPSTEPLGIENYEYGDYILSPYNIVSKQDSINSQQGSQLDRCGQVLLNKPNTLAADSKPTLEGQWPWQVALFMSRLLRLDTRYICSGTLISNQHVVTAAHCITRKNSNRIVDNSTLTVFLGKHNLRTSIDGVQIDLVTKIIVHPSYDPITFSNDLAILKIRNPVTFTNWVQPVCLWPESTVHESNIIGKTGSVVGWGFHETQLTPAEELTLVEMPVVDTKTCVDSYSEFFKKYTSPTTYCAGYKQSNAICNGDSGAAMVFKIGSLWYFRGMVSLSVATTRESFHCDTNHYVVFTDLAKFLPWIKRIINSESK